MYAIPILLILGTTPGALEEAETDRLLAAWGEKFKDTRSLEVRFRQEKRLKILRRPLISQGLIRLSEGNLLCILKNAQDEAESTLSIRQGTLKILYPRLQRLEVYELGAEQRAPALSFPVFGSNPEALKRDFDLKLERAGGRDRLTLSPKDPKAPVGSMTLVLEDLEVVEVEQQDKNGDLTKMEIQKFIRNPKLEAKDLELEIPPGTREVHPLGSPKPKKSDAPPPTPQK